MQIRHLGPQELFDEGNEDGTERGTPGVPDPPSMSMTIGTRATSRPNTKVRGLL